MPGRTLFRVGFLAFVMSQSHFALCRAQSNACPDTSSDETESHEGPKIIIDNIEYLGDNPLTDAQRSAVLSQIKTIAGFNSNESIQEQDTLDNLSIAVKAALQDSGYFRAVVTPRIFFVRAEPDAVHYVFSVSIHSGLQYHLGNVHFRSTDPDHPLAFSESDLRPRLDLKQGDLFDVSKIREGLDSLQKLYRSKGFIDMVPTPDQQIHEPDSRHDNPDPEDASDAEVDPTIDLTIAIDEGKPYRISKIEVVGLLSDTVQQLQLPQVAGDVFSPNLWKDYFDKGVPPLPKDASMDKNVKIRRNTKYGTLSLAVDFGPCGSGPAPPIVYSEVAPPEPTPAPANPSLPMRTKSEPDNSITSEDAPAPQ